jgi:membrane protease YdiL (CAAX protease family)
LEGRLKPIDILLVIGMAILPLIIDSVFIFTSSYPQSTEGRSHSLVMGIITSSLSLGLVAYIMHVRKIPLKLIGLTYTRNDIFYGIILLLITYILYTGAFYVGYFIFGEAFLSQAQPKNIDHISGGFSYLLLIFIIINPFFEEIIVRGFLMGGIMGNEGKLGYRILAILISTIVQLSYHLYQGLVPVALLTTLFLTFSIYFAITRRLAPVLFAHLMYDLFILLY